MALSNDPSKLFVLNPLWKEELTCKIHKKLGLSFVTDPALDDILSVGIATKYNDQRDPTTLRCVLMCEDARLPTRATPGSAGLDIYSPHGFALGPLQRLVIPTGLAAQPPSGSYLRLVSRSSLASRGVDVVAGIVDPDFTGEIGVVLYNSNVSSRFIHPPGDRKAICQAIVTPYLNKDPLQVTKLLSTERGARGFGKVTEDQLDANYLAAEIDDTVSTLDSLQLEYNEVTTRRQKTKRLERVRFEDHPECSLEIPVGKLESCECGMAERGRCLLCERRHERDDKVVKKKTEGPELVVKCRLCPYNVLIAFRCLCIDGGEPHHNNCCDSADRIPGLRKIRDPATSGPVRIPTEPHDILKEWVDEDEELWKEFDALGNELGSQEQDEIWEAIVERLKLDEGQGAWSKTSTKDALEIGAQRREAIMERKILRARRKQKRREDDEELSG